MYCRQHKLNNMVNVRNKKCIFKNCKLKSIYNYEGKKNPMYCNKHKLNDMIDVTHNLCIHKRCRK